MVHRPLMSKSSQNFWDFSIQFYGVDGVAEACLELQNSHGLDVNMVLLCVWFGKHNGKLADSSMEQALEFSNHWRSCVVQPLRATRQWMKGHPPPAEGQQLGFNDLREQIKKVELSAEKHQQESLQQIVSQGPCGDKDPADEAKEFDAIQENLRNLLVRLQTTDSTELNAALSVITRTARGLL